MFYLGFHPSKTPLVSFSCGLSRPFSWSFWGCFLNTLVKATAMESVVHQGGFSPLLPYNYNTDTVAALKFLQCSAHLFTEAIRIQVMLVLGHFCISPRFRSVLLPAVMKDSSSSCEVLRFQHSWTQRKWSGKRKDFVLPFLFLPWAAVCGRRV